MQYVAPVIWILVALVVLAALCAVAGFGIRGSRRSNARVIEQAISGFSAGHAEVFLPMGCGMSPDEVSWFAQQYGYTVRQWPGTYRNFYLLAPGAPPVAQRSSAPHPPLPPPRLEEYNVHSPSGNDEKVHEVNASYGYHDPTPEDLRKIRRNILRQRAGGKVMGKIALPVALAILFVWLAILQYKDGHSAYLALAFLAGVALLVAVVTFIESMILRKGDD